MYTIRIRDCWVHIHLMATLNVKSLLDGHSRSWPPSSGKVNQSYCFNIGFWLKEASYKEQPEVHFKHQFILFLQGLTSDSYVAYSTYQNFNNLVNDKLRIPITKVVYCLIFNRLFASLAYYLLTALSRGYNCLNHIPICC